MNKRRVCQLLLILLQIALFTGAFSSWWVRKNNHLFGNGRWIVGKDTGKFVFYTYGYMFKALSKNRLDLADAMGHQEILYHQPEGPTRRLRSLSFETEISPRSYIWIELQKEKQRTVACRLSRKPDYPGGFFEFDERGYRQRHEPFATPPSLSDEWAEVRLTRRDGYLVVAVDDKELGRFAPAMPAAGHFGFRGSGRARSEVLIRNIQAVLEDPERPGKTWTMEESFSGDALRADALLLFAALATFIASLRAIRTRILAGYLDEGVDDQFATRDLLGFALCGGGAAVLPASSVGLNVPAALALAELLTLVALVAAVRRSTGRRRPRVGASAVYALVVLAVFTMAFKRHGSGLGRGERTIWDRMENVDPAAFTMIPDGEIRSSSSQLRKPTRIIPGRPFFFSGHSYREQEIQMTFDISHGCTFDVVFQQQAYQTLGDPGGEELPLQRRLIRLSTRKDVPWGIAVGTRKKPAPFIRLNGSLKTGERNHLKIVAEGEALRVELNGAVSQRPGFANLGFGETGCMVYEDGVDLSTFTVASIEPLLARRSAIFVGGGVLLVYLSASFLLFRLFGRIGLLATLPSLTAALFMVAVYLALSLATDRAALAFLGGTRLLWLDASLLAAALMLPGVMAIHGYAMRAKPLLFNLLFLLILGPALLLAWDLLPDSHALKLQLDPAAVAPGERIELDLDRPGPWYNNNDAIGASTYIWKQRFGPESVTQEKRPGVVRILATGGSQAWGSGAATSFDTYDSILERRLKAADHPVEIYNAGINGAGVSQVRLVYEGLLAGFRPDIIVVNVGLNDSVALKRLGDSRSASAHRQVLIRQFKELVALCKRQRVDLVLVQEAMSRESPNRPDDELYDALAAHAAAQGCPVIDARATVWERERDHMVWWDPAHFTPFGHELLADIIEPELEKLVRKRRQQASAVKPPPRPPAASRAAGTSGSAADTAASGP